MDRNLEDVDHFYNKKYSDLSRRLKLLEDRYSDSPQAVAQLDTDEREDLLAALLELRGQLRKLQWYGEVNRRGFIKITKKLDKRIPQAHAQKKYLELKVDPSPFATNAQLFASLNKINDWISVLGEVAASLANKADDVASISSGSLRRTTSRPSLNISTEQLAKIETKIKQDDANSLEDWIKPILKGSSDNSEAAVQLLLNNLLQRAISSRSRDCTAVLLREIVFLDAQDDINRRNSIHRLVISIGRKQANADQDSTAEASTNAEADSYNFITPAAHPSTALKRSILQEDQRIQILTREDGGISFLQFFLNHLRSSQRPALLARDSAGKTPLHFAAEYGIKIMCEVIIEHLRAWKLFDVSNGIDSSRWQDDEGWAPLHLSAVGGHPLTTEALLDAEEAGGVQVKQRSPKSSAVLALATKANYIEIVRLLIKAGVDINYQDEQGDTALHVAARFGHVECAKLLLEGRDEQRANIELPEKTYGWTPLFIACVDGHLSIVELLIEYGADLERLDSSGWDAKEHAALRGHVNIARRLDSFVPEDQSESEGSVASTSPSLSSSLSSSLAERNSNSLGFNGPTVRTTEPVKSFGHRYLTDKSMILVSLGTMDTRKLVQAVNLDRIPLSSAHSTQLDTALSIVVSAKSAEGEAEVIDLPVQDNISTEPIVFHATDPSKVKIYFDLIPTYSGSQDRVVGRGVALLSSMKSDFGNKKMSLQGDVTVPIVAASDLEVIGSVTFNFLVITPFRHPNMSITENQTYWKSMASTMVIGHRGLGKNFAAGRRSLQLGENTIQSFIAAANLGASYVEFDVQLTKDHVPVIYHDFLVSETGIDAPVHTLTLEQFLHVNDARTPRPSRPASPVLAENPKLANLRNRSRESRASRLRSMSMGGADSNESLEMDERMKHTRDFKKKGFKGNSRGNHIQAPFATLEEMFKQIPQEVGFNIEMKYPMLFESQDEEMDTYAVELNSFVDTVLSKVYDLGKGRNVLFSSFNPDICLLLSFKQPSIPVLFLTDSGTSPAGDIRATSLQEAIRFASRWNLLGIVSAADPLVAAPRLVRVVKESGLVCVSYGTLNNDNKMVRRQVKQGIDAVIVDNVLAIRRGLTEDAAKANGTSVESNGTAGLKAGRTEVDVNGGLEKSLLSGIEGLKKLPDPVQPIKQ